MTRLLEDSKMRYAKTLMALTVACLLVVPAFSMPSERGALNAYRGWAFSPADLTEEELVNMTIGELKALKQEQREEQREVCENMTLGELREYRQTQREEREEERNNMTLGELRQQRQKESRINKGDGMSFNRAKEPIMGPGRAERPAMGLEMLLFSQMDLTEEDLENMTIGELREYKLELREKFENMTVGELEELRLEQKEKLENMTIGELREERQKGSIWLGHTSHGFDEKLKRYATGYRTAIGQA